MNIKTIRQVALAVALVAATNALSFIAGVMHENHRLAYYVKNATSSESMEAYCSAKKSGGTKKENPPDLIEGIILNGNAP